MTAFLKRPLLLALVILIVQGCASRLETVQITNPGTNLNGTWQIVDEAGDSIAGRHGGMLRMPQVRQSRGGRQSRQISAGIDPSLLQNMILELLQLPEQNLYIAHDGQQIAIDYGVADYHNFIAGEVTEMILAGVPVKAVAGWQDKKLVIQMEMDDLRILRQEFQRLDDNSLLNTLIWKSGRDNSVERRWQRWYQRLPSN